MDLAESLLVFLQVMHLEQSGQRNETTSSTSSWSTSSLSLAIGISALLTEQKCALTQGSECWTNEIRGLSSVGSSLSKGVPE